MSSPLYNRRVELAVGTYGDTGRVWSDLRTTFTVRHVRRSAPNAARVEVYNLSADSRAWLEQPDRVCWLRAGYTGDDETASVPLVLTGDVMFAEHVRSGPDIVTRLHVREGERALRNAWVSTSTAGVRTRRDLLARVTDHLAAAGPFAPTVQDALDAAVGDEWSGPVGSTVIDAGANDALDAAMPDGWTWTIVDGVLRIVPPTGELDGTAYVLSPDTGLLESPRHRVRTTRGRVRADGIEARCLLLGELRPGRVVRVESRDITGDFVATEVEHSGDTHADRWETSLLLEPRQ